MRAPAVSFAQKIAAATLAALLTFTLVPFAHADREGASEDSAESVALDSPDQSNDSDDSVILSEGTEGPSSSVTLSEAAEGGEVEGFNSKPLTLASGLVGKPGNFISSDVALDSEPVVGSFTVDGLTFAVIDGPYVELVGVSSSVILSAGSEAAEVEESNSNQASKAGLANLVLLDTITYEGVSRVVSSIGAYAFYLSGVTSVTLPASVNDVDDRAFRSSDVASVTVADGNLTYSSFDGALYDAEQLSLLLIPEGKQGTVRIPKTAEVVEASVFSHCPLVDSISVDAGSAALASENGLLYSSDLTTLLRVPAGATEITIREGCTTIAAGAMEACANLERINAQSTVTSISPDIFHAIPTVSLPAAALAEEASQLTAVVVLATIDDGLPEINPSSVTVSLPQATNEAVWLAIGFNVGVLDLRASTQEGASYSAGNASAFVYSDATTYRKAAADSVSSFSSAGGSWWRWTTGTTSSYRFYDGSLWLYHAPSKAPWRLGFIKDSCNGVTAVDVGVSEDALQPLTESAGWIPTEAGGTYYFRVYAEQTVTWDATGGLCDPTQSVLKPGESVQAPVPAKESHKFLGWYTSAQGGDLVCAPGDKLSFDHGIGNVTYFAQWQRVDYDLGFDVSSEPGNTDYAGEPKDDQTVSIEDGRVPIEDPKRPGYVFQGWTIPDVSGMYGYQDVPVYQDDTNGKWYVDAPKLPNYADENGRIELTARWTSIISADVPSSVTFYADVVTQGNESREGLASGAFGQSKVASQSEVDLRIVGLESEPVYGNGSTSLGAADIVKKKDGKPVSTTVDMLFSVYPVEKALSEDDLKDPDRESEKPAGAASFALDGILLEKAFESADFTIPAGDTLSLGYRLNLQETDAVLDYEKLATLPEGGSASIANISYCFAADGLTPAEWGEPFWFENEDASVGRAGYYLLKDIKAAADDLSVHASDPAQSSYYPLYSSMVGTGTFHLKVDGRYLDVQLLGICQDAKTAGGKAGLTFQTKDIYAFGNKRSDIAGGGAFSTSMNATNSNADSWGSSAMRTQLCETFWGSIDKSLREAIAPLDKYQQLGNGEISSVTGIALQKTTGETIWLPSAYEVFGIQLEYHNESEGSSAVGGYTPFQYQAFQSGGTGQVNASAIKKYNGSPTYWWLRTAYRVTATNFCIVYINGSYGDDGAIAAGGVAPCFAL